jgi:type IV pilus assembly protein PilA
MIVRKEKGFTLIELMVVVLIIGILVAIAVPVFNVARENAWRRTCQSNLRTLDGAIQSYYSSYETFPSSFYSPYPVSIDGSHQLVQGQFIKAAPECPKAKSRGDANGDGNYYYVVSGTTPPDLSVECPGAQGGASGYTNHTY